MRRLIFAITCLTALVAAQQKPTPGQSLAADWGPRLDSPGVTVVARKAAALRTPAGTQLDYRLVASGFPAGAILQIVSWPITDPKPSVALEGVTLDSSGRAVCAGRGPDNCGDPNKPDDPIDLKFFARAGEPMRFALVTADFKIRAFTIVVPFPIAASDRGCRLEAIVGSRTAAAVLIRGAGFPPQARLTVDTTSAGEHLHGSSAQGLVASAGGSFTTLLMPFAKNVASGVAVFRVEAKTCAPEVRVAWGPASNHPE